MLFELHSMCRSDTLPESGGARQGRNWVRVSVFRVGLASWFLDLVSRLGLSS